MKLTFKALMLGSALAGLPGTAAAATWRRRLYRFGVIMTCNVAVGLFTPPVGATLYVASRISAVGVLSIARKMGLLYGAAICALLLVTYVPAVSLTMVELFR